MDVIPFSKVENEECITQEDAEVQSVAARLTKPRDATLSEEKKEERPVRRLELIGDDGSYNYSPLTCVTLLHRSRLKRLRKRPI